MKFAKILQRANDERGVALVTAMLVTTAVLSLSIAAVAISVHGSVSSSYDRGRTQALHASEAGIDQMVAYFKTVNSTQLCAASSSAAASGNLTQGSTGPQIANYTVTVTCDSLTNPRQVLISSVGTAPNPTGAGRAIRKMESLVNVKARRFGHALFHNSATTQLDLSNNSNGNGFIDADVYSNANVVQSNSVTISGDITSQGSVTLGNNTVVKGSIWAKGSVAISNSVFVGGSVTSSRGSITLTNSAKVAGSARALGTITAPAGAIGGAITPNSPSADPPYETLPTFTWNPADPWPAPVSQYSACTGLVSFQTWFTATQAALAGTARIAGTGSQVNCAFDLGNQNNMGLIGDLAIINDGDITFGNNTNWSSADGEHHNLYLVSLNGNINFANSTSFDPSLSVFVFTNHQANLNNQNNFKGLVYADVLNITNNFTLDFNNLFPPGFTSASNIGYNVDTIYLREVKT